MHRCWLLTGRGRSARNFVQASRCAAEGCGQGGGFVGESGGVLAIEGFVCAGEDFGGVSGVGARGVDGVFVPGAA